jgi:hypothetical protein
MDVKPHQVGFGQSRRGIVKTEVSRGITTSSLKSWPSETTELFTLRVAARITQGWVGASPSSVPSMAYWFGFGEGELVATISFCL